MHPTRALIAAAVLTSLAGCAVHHHPRAYPTWQDYRHAHPHARFVVVHHRPARDRTCWKVSRGWRCVAR